MKVGTKLNSLDKNLKIYQQFLQSTEIQSAYRELINFINHLANCFRKKFPEYEVAHGFYQGYLDLTFFTFTTRALNYHQLKIAVVFKHKDLNFEVWLSGRNRSIMSKFHKLFQSLDLHDYFLSVDETGMSSIVESLLITEPNFDDLNKLTHDIETGIYKFVEDMEKLIQETDLDKY